jgi:hypothetical protein
MRALFFVRTFHGEGRITGRDTNFLENGNPADRKGTGTTFN